MITFIDKGTKVRVTRVNNLLKDIIFYAEYSIPKTSIRDVVYDKENDRVLVTMLDSFEYDFDHKIVEATFSIQNNITDNRSLFEFLDNML